MLNAQFLMLSSVFCFSLAGYFSSLLALHLLAFSMLIRFFVPMVFSFVKIKSFDFLKESTFKMIILCIARGMVIFSSQYILYLCIHKIGLASGLILYNMGPIFLIVLFTILGNKIKKQDIFLITFSFIGVLVFFDFEFKVENEGVILGIVAAVLYAVSQYINADMAKHNADPKTIILLVNFSATIIAAIYLLFFVGPIPNLSTFHISSWLIILAMGLATYFNQYLRIIAYKVVDNPNTIVYLTFFAIPFSLFFNFFEDKMISPDQIYGSLIILGGALTPFYLHKKRTAKSSSIPLSIQPEKSGAIS